MSRVIILDSTPLGLLTQRSGATEADACRNWLAGHTQRGARVLIPEIADYELRRELIRVGQMRSVARLDALIGAPAVRYLPLTTAAMRLAAQLWAQVRQQGLPTAHPHSLDVDVILSAQALSAGFPLVDLVIATSNVGHLSRFLAAELWQNI